MKWTEAMKFALNSWSIFMVYIMILGARCAVEIFDSTATIKFFLHNEDNEETVKYVRGIYTTAGTVFDVEGNMEQVHPNTLCSMSPQLTLGKIYILKLEKRSVYSKRGSFCGSSAEKVRIAITQGANAVILITTDRHEETVNELDRVTQPLERPVIIIQETTEEEKILAILNQWSSAYMRIKPVKSPVPVSEQPVQGATPYRYKQENITYIGIAVIFGLIIVLVVVAVGVIVKFRSIRRRIQSQTRGRLLESIGTHKYRQKALHKTLSSSSTLESPGPCPICLEQYRIGEELRLLPCTHQYHRKCIDKWLMEHRTCPCCCGDIDELLRLGAESHQDSYYKTPTTSSVQSHLYSHCTTERLLNESYTRKHGHSNTSRHHGHYKPNIVQYENGAMKALLPPNDQEIFVHQQYQYLLQRLYEIKRQRPSSTTASDTEASNRLSVLSSSYGSTFDFDIDGSSIPCENNFIGDSCQGGIPNRCDLALCDIEISDKPPIRQYTSSKSTLPSVESANMSPRVSELDLSVTSSQQKLSHDQCAEPCGHCHHKPGHRKRRRSLRMVRFREPESEVMSSADAEEEEDLYPCECEPCQACRLKESTTSKEPSVRWSDQDSCNSQSQNALLEEKLDNKAEESS